MKENIRPWGHYEIISKTKIIYVNSDSQLSLQTHSKRDEFWRIIEGSAIVTIDNKDHDAKVGSTFFIPKKTKHRITTKKESCKFIEISTGEVDENDIVRLEDRYNRKSSKNEQK